MFELDEFIQVNRESGVQKYLIFISECVFYVFLFVLDIRNGKDVPAERRKGRTVTR
jgi:hypothetical protein